MNKPDKSAAEKSPEFAERIRLLEPLSPDEKSEMATNARKLLSRTKEGYLGFRHCTKAVTIELDDIPSWGEQVLNITDQPETDGLYRRTVLRITGPEVAVLERVFMKDTRIVRIDQPDEMGVIRQGDIQHWRELLEHPERFSGIDPNVPDAT